MQEEAEVEVDLVPVVVDLVTVRIEHLQDQHTGHQHTSLQSTGHQLTSLQPTGHQPTIHLLTSPQPTGHQLTSHQLTDHQPTDHQLHLLDQHTGHQQQDITKKHTPEEPYAEMAVLMMELLLSAPTVHGVDTFR